MTNYALIHNKMAGQTQRIPLPAMVGSDERCDIIINAAAVRAFAYQIDTDGKSLQLTKVDTGATADATVLQRFGLQLAGPLPAKNQQLQPKSPWREGLAKEGMWFDRLPDTIALLTGGFLQQKWRFATWLTCLALIFILMVERDVTKAVDLSEQPIAISVDEVSSQIIGYTVARQGYERGTTLAIEMREQDAAFDQLISFQAAKLDVGGEVKFTFRDQTLVRSEPMPNCMKKFCPVTFRVPAGTFEAGQNLIRIEHDPDAGFYILGQLLVRPLPQISAEEIKRVERWEATANRAYNERDIVPKNLVHARRDLDQALDFLARRAGADDLRARLEAFRTEAEAAFANEVADRWARVDVNMKLKKYDIAEFHLGTLMDLHPDTSTAEHREIQNRLAELKELKK